MFAELLRPPVRVHEEGLEGATGKDHVPHRTQSPDWSLEGAWILLSRGPEGWMDVCLTWWL